VAGDGAGDVVVEGVDADAEDASVLVEALGGRLTAV
jgi:hypothetical protein